MPPRGSSEGLDFTPILTHYLFLFTSILSFVLFFSIILPIYSSFHSDRMVPCIYFSMHSHCPT